MITIPENQVNDLLSMLEYNDGTWEVIDEELMEDFEGLPRELLGYQFKVKQRGEHYNDGQMVDYTFKFKNPNGIITKLKTKMCLMIGWNHSGNNLVIL